MAKSRKKARKAAKRTAKKRKPVVKARARKPAKKTRRVFFARPGFRRGLALFRRSLRRLTRLLARPTMLLFPSFEPPINASLSLHDCPGRAPDPAGVAIGMSAKIPCIAARAASSCPPR